MNGHLKVCGGDGRLFYRGRVNRQGLAVGEARNHQQKQEENAQQR